MWLGDYISYFLSTSTPTIRKMPKSLYARQYLVGAQATTGQAPAVLNVWTCSPVSTCDTSRPDPTKKQNKNKLAKASQSIGEEFLPSSLPPTTKLPSNVKPEVKKVS